MNDTSTITHGYIIITYNVMSFFTLFLHEFTGTVKQRLILFIFQVFSCKFFKDLISRRFFCGKLAKNCIQQCFCHIISITVCCLYFAVSILRICTKSHVRWQSPRSCGPCQEVCILTFYLKPCNSRTLFYQLIALGNLLSGKRCPTSWTVRHDLKSFV